MNPPLLHFVTAGLLDTVGSFRAGALPLHRFAWELRTRVDALAELGPPARTLTRLRWLQRTVEHLHASGAAAGALTATLADLAGVLATLVPPAPDDPSGAGRPYDAAAG